MLSLSPTRRRNARGMTIIEIMIVVAVIAIMVGMVVVGFGATRAAEVTRTVNRISNIIRYGYDKARVNGVYYRLHIDFEKNAFSLQEGDEKMYLPATDRDGKLVDTEETKDKEEEQAQRDKRAEQTYNQSVQSEIFEQTPEEGDGGAPAAAAADQELDPYKAQARRVPRRKPPLFQAFEDENSLSGLSKGFALPEGVKIISVRTADDFAEITKGEASLYFFPRGRTQKAHILIEDEEGETKYTIKVEPLTGRVTIVEGHEPLVMPDDPDEEEDDLGNRRQRRTF